MTSLLDEATKMPNRPLYTPYKKPRTKTNRPPNKERMSNVANILSTVIAKRSDFGNGSHGFTRAGNLTALRETSKVMRNLISTKELQKADMKYKTDLLIKMVKNANKPVTNNNRLDASFNREIADKVRMKNLINSNKFKTLYKNSMRELRGNNYSKGKMAYNKALSTLAQAI